MRKPGAPQTQTAGETMPRPTRRWPAVAAWTILTAITLGVGLLTAAMHLYPGGTVTRPTSGGHSFWTNFLCDLTNDIAVNGRPNHPGATIARAAMLAFCLALGCFWIVLPESFRERRALAAAIRACGVASAIGLAVVPLATGPAHVQAVFASAVPALVAGGLGLVAVVRFSRSRVSAVTACATVAASLVDTALYARSYLTQPRVVSPALPFFQRVALLLMLAWMGGVAVGVLRAHARSRG